MQLIHEVLSSVKKQLARVEDENLLPCLCTKGQLCFQTTQAAIQIGADVVRVLKPYGQTDEVLYHTSGLALLFAEFAVRGGGGVGDGGFYIAQIAGDAAKPGLVDKGKGVVADLLWGGIARAGAYAKG